MKTRFNVHEINKYLKNHEVSVDDFEAIVNEIPRLHEARKPKVKRETYESWKLRNDIA